MSPAIEARATELRLRLKTCHAYSAEWLALNAQLLALISSAR